MVLIQGRGKHNVLGQVKFLLEKSRAIFLHDTNDRSMFRFDRRDFSHGFWMVCGGFCGRFVVGQWSLFRVFWGCVVACPAPVAAPRRLILGSVLP